MASPVGGGNQGSGSQNLEARIRAWVRDELQKAARGGIGLHLDGATGNLIIDNGDIRSGNYVASTSGWDLKPSGDQELHGNTTIGGSSTINGTLSVGANTTIGGSLNVTGPMTVGGTLSLPNGIINNAALANPVTTIVLNGNQNGISVPLSWTDYIPLTFTVPNGFTSCSILASLSGSPYVTSPGGSSGAVQVRAVINGVAGALDSSGWLAAGDQRTVAANYAATVSGLTGGGSVIVKAQAQATAGTPNMDFLNLSALAVFTR